MASRQHAALTCSSNGVVSIKDFGSTNKTWVDDEPIPPKEEIGLDSGNQIRIGGNVFSFVAYSSEMEPRKTARRSSKMLTEMDTVSSGLQWKDGQIVMHEGEDEDALENQTISAKEIMKTVTQPLAPVGNQPSLAGQLSVQSLPNLLQFLLQHANTGELVVDTDDLTGMLVFEKGRLVFAKAGSIEGEEAVFACALKREGSFRFNNLEEVPAEPRNVTMPMMQIIFECCKRYDDSEREAGGAS